MSWLAEDRAAVAGTAQRGERGLQQTIATVDRRTIRAAYPSDTGSSTTVCGSHA